MLLNKLFYVFRHMNYIPGFLLDYYNFKKRAPEWPCRIIDALPVFHERTTLMSFDKQYVYHTGWAARVLREISPKLHIDISSSIMFSSIMSAFIPIEHYDYRRPILNLVGLECGNQDLLNLRFKDGSISSLSCMHVIEHIGLGRYGDPINPTGDLEAAKELKRVLAPGGHLIIVVPLAECARIRFNGHRIYDYKRITELFGDCDLIEFSFLNESTDFTFKRNAKAEDIAGSRDGCGCFLFKMPL